MALGRSAHGLAPLSPTTRDEQALLTDLPFETGPSDDFGTAITVLANRSVDFGENEPTDLSSLVRVHGAEENQRRHCLRRSANDGNEGAQAALGDCRAFIREQFALGLDGLDEQGRVDRTKTETFPIYLNVRGELEFDAPRFFVGLGRAMHTVQDGFSHTYRTSDNLRVVEVLNYSELVEDELDEEVDGPPHAGELDQCLGLDDFRAGRLSTAQQASVEIATLAYDPSLSREEKMTRLDMFLDVYFAYEPGCDASNDWCQAPEREYKDSEPITCSAKGGTTTSATALGIFAVAALLLLRGRKKRLLVGATFVAVLGAMPVEAEASDFGVYVGGSGAVMNSAFSGSVGGRYYLTEHWILGLDAEWNPWISGTSGIRKGAVNFYGTTILRYPLQDDTVNLRTTLQLGVSRIMFDLVGVAEGSIGPYIAFNPLGLEWRFADDVYLIVDPAHISIPIPQWRGVPFAYPQYRVTVGLQWGASGPERE